MQMSHDFLGVHETHKGRASPAALASSRDAVFEVDTAKFGALPYRDFSPRFAGERFQIAFDIAATVCCHN